MIFGIIGVLLAALVVFVLLPLFLLFLFIQYRGGNEEMYQTAAAVKSGTVTELLPWGSSSLGELTREWVGSSTYTVSTFGRRDQAAGRVPSGRSPTGWLLAFTMESSSNGADGKLLAVSSAHKLELSVKAGTCKAAINGAALGSFRVGEPALLGPDGAQLGTYRPDLTVGQLTLRGREVATIDTRTGSDAGRVDPPSFLVTHLLAERTPEDEAWTLVVAVLQLGWLGPRNDFPPSPRGGEGRGEGLQAKA